MNQYLDNIDNDIAQKHLLKHPFYLAWTRGELTRQALTDYARQYYHHVAAFPTYLSAVHAKCDVIEEINQQPVSSVSDYNKIASSLDPSQPQVLSVCRHRMRSFLVLRPR